VTVSSESSGAVATFASAARSFAVLVHHIPADRWAVPGLGEWDLRSLVGHASRSLITVSTYLGQPAEREDVTSPQDYYVQIRELASKLGAADIIERGRQAGRDLGDDPAATVDRLLQRVLDDLSDAGDPLIAVIGGLGIRLHSYLPTRTFELAVHGLDIARAVDVSFQLPADVLAEATELAARIAVADGHGQTVLLALTGRGELPPSFSVV
jgi:uncharacterized protein (TIGR03083 family)